MLQNNGKEYRDALILTFVEVSPLSTDQFLKVKETLTRMGIASQKTKTLWQSCHVLHKLGHYYICHFKELFALDGKAAGLSDDDLMRRNNIACALEDWGMLTIIQMQEPASIDPALGKFTVIKHADKQSWTLSQKYTVGGVKVKLKE